MSRRKGQGNQDDADTAAAVDDDDDDDEVDPPLRGRRIIPQYILQQAANQPARRDGGNSIMEMSRRVLQDTGPHTHT